MLGKLARWLRLLGYDACYPGGTDDDALLDLARSSDRLLLTRDVWLAQRVEDENHVVLLRNLDPREQVQEVVQALELQVPPERVLTRCSLCNDPVDATTYEDVGDRTPPDVGPEDGPFRRCRGCDQVYWEGSHVAEIRAFAEALRHHGSR